MELLCFILSAFPSPIPAGNIEFTIQVDNLFSTVYSQEDKRHLVKNLLHHCDYRWFVIGKDEMLVAGK